MTDLFTSEDLKRLSACGISTAEAQRQVAVLSRPLRCRELVRACSVGDGILVLGDEDRSRAVEAFDAARDTVRIAKFVPASGAASRMFESLQRYRTEFADDSGARLAHSVAAGDGAATLVQQFFERLDDFAFVEELAAAIEKEGDTLSAWRQEQRWHDILGVLLGRDRLNYGRLPKALIKFHRVGSRSRSALEEHLVEAALLLAGAGSPCRVHFTIHPDHEAVVRQALGSVQPSLESRYGVRYEIELSFQDARTMTVALGNDGLPFHLADGSLLLRPGGHGSLIYNVDRLDASVALIGNIDNVVPDRFKKECVYWKKVLAGHLLRLREKTFEFVRALRERSIDAEKLDGATSFARHAWNIELASELAGGSADSGDRRRALLQALDRPMRVCGVVKNEGEPGGGPFWVAGGTAGTTLQIVEGAEVNLPDAAQKKIFDAASHFNPVNLACSLTDADGRAFDLEKFVDREAVFIARKSEAGAELLALERPGLWNGAMSDWLTVFVETPIETFNPVKEVNDLLRERHQ